MDGPNIPLSYLFLYVLFYVSYGYDQCLRKNGIYHDTGMVRQDDIIDSKSSLAFKYLGIAEKREQSRLLNTFNWTEIITSVKDDFNRSCNLGNGSYLYNYTLVFETFIGEEISDTTTVSPTNEAICSTSSYQSTTSSYDSEYMSSNYTEKAMKFLSVVLGVNESNIYDYILLSSGNSSQNISRTIGNESLTKIDSNGNMEGHIPFSQHGYCSNISPERIKFSIVNMTTGTRVKVILEGLSVSQGNFSSSSDAISCIKENMGNISCKASVESNCDNCSMKFMATVTSVPKSFNDTMEKIGLTENNSTNSFYLCGIVGDTGCSDFVSFEDITVKSTINVIKSISDNSNHSRSRRSVSSSISLTAEEFDCKYISYPETETCSSKIRERRSDKNPKTESDTDLIKHARKHLGSKPIIPPKATHLQEGIHRMSHSGVTGDGAIYAEVKKNIKDLVKQITLSLPSSAKPEDLYARVSKLPKLPPKVKQDMFTEALRTTIEQKQASVSEVIYADLEFTKRHTPLPEKRYGGNTIYSRIDFPSRRESISSIDSESDFVDMSIIKKQLEDMRLGGSRGGRRVSSTSSESDFEDIEQVRRQIEQTRRMSSTSSESDFEDIQQVMEDYRRIKEQKVMKKGTTPIDPAGNVITKSLEGKMSKIKGIDIAKSSNPHAASIISGVDTGSVVAKPLTRKGAIRKYKNPSKIELPPIDDDIYYSPARTPSLDDEIYMEGPTNGKARHMSPSSRPLPPIPPKQSARDYLPIPQRRGSGRSLSPISEESNPNSGAIPKSIHRRCRRSLDGVICGMLQSRPSGESPYSLAGNPESPYSLAGRPKVYEKIGGIPSEDVRLMDNKQLIRGNAKRSGIKDYKGTMKQISTSFDKSLIFGGAMLMAGQQAMQQQTRQSALQRKDSMSEQEKIFEAVTMSLSTLGTTLTSAGLAGGPKLMVAGMAISAISGIIDTVKDIYYLFSETEKPVDPIIKLFNTYSGLIDDRDRSGVRKCMVPGEDMMVYMAYSNDSKRFKPELEKTALYFLDVIDSEILYLNTSNLILDYQLRVACPIGVLRSPDTDITAYTTMYSDGDVKKYMFTRLGVMLSRTPTVRLTCGRDTTLTIRPYEVPISDMQLLKMVTPGEPKDTMSIPSHVCDMYPLKKFYLLAEGCPYDTSQTFIVHTTCSILLRMSTWDPFRKRWVLQNPFRQEGEYKQLFTFSKYDFNDTIIDPNNKPGHASFCVNRQARQCYWSESMVLEDVNSCQARSRKIYVKIRVFGDRGFDSFVLTCPSGSTPVSIDADNSILELPVGDYGTSKLFASTQDNKKIGVFCVHNYDKRYKSDVIVLIFEKNKYDYGIKMNNFDSRDNLFSRMSVGMPLRSRKCDNRKEGCYIGGVDFKNPDIEMEVHHSPKEIMLKETYDANSVDPQVVNKSKKYFPAPIKVTFPVNNLGNAYKNPEKFWEDAIKKTRTYSSILVNVAACTSRNKNMFIDNPISTMGYLQSKTKDYGDGSHYYFKKVTPDMYNVGDFMFRYNANCSATLNLKSRDMTVECDPFSIPRSSVKSYEGLCFIVVTSRDHCATETEWLKKKGYDEWDATKPRNCYYSKTKKTVSLDHYCSYSGDLYNYYPDYDACKSYMFVEYKDAWVESEVLQQPPYTFEFIYDKNKNEYVDKELSDRMNELYEEYRKLMEYTDGSLPNSINRLAKALTSEGREITNVNVDGNVLELAYQADREKIMEIQEKISELTKEIFVHTLSSDDLKEIMEAADNDRCCIIDVRNNKTVKYYPIDNYICGDVSDYVFTDEEDRKYILANNTYISYDYLNQSGAVISTCYNASIIPLDTEEARKMVEEAIISSAISEALNEVFDEMDANVSIALISEEERYLSSPEHRMKQVGYIAVIVSVIVVILIITALVYVWLKKIKKYDIINSTYVSSRIELDSGSYVNFSETN